MLSISNNIQWFTFTLIYLQWLQMTVYHSEVQQGHSNPKVVDNLVEHLE